MAQKILIMGESGTGKSTSIRLCDPKTTAIINPVGKPLPFKGSNRYRTLNGETDADNICKWMRVAVQNGYKMIVVDDFQYILAIPYMERIKETGWDKFSDFGANYFKIIDVCKELPDDVCVYYMTHTETLENGVTTVKLIGKMLREKITIEGLFTIVLKSGVSEGKYMFFTQNNGKDTVKSPIGMFDAYTIDNDLKYIDAKIRNYYELDGAKNDEEIAKLDEEKTIIAEKPEGRRRRGGAKPIEETPESSDNPEPKANDGNHRRHHEKRGEWQKIEDDEELPFGGEIEQHEETTSENAQDTTEDVPEEISFEDAPDPEPTAPVKRTRRHRDV